MSGETKGVIIRAKGPLIANTEPITIIAGVNVLESRPLAMNVATALKKWTTERDIGFVFKASWDKANRSAFDSYRGPGLEQGLTWLREIRTELDIPIITDIHEPEQAGLVGEIADILQIPAFLSRQTDLLAAACATGRPILVKKMQMMSPLEMGNVVDKCRALGARDILLCERGTSFGYGNLVVDPLSFEQMKALGVPVVFDVTHALQQPGSLGSSTGGRGTDTLSLALAGVSQGLAGLFFECHPEPREALCDGPCALPLDQVPELLDRIQAMDRLVKSWP